MLAFAGTDPSSMANWGANTDQAVGFGSSQYEQGLSLAIAVHAATGGNVLFAGHSLGGGIASAAAYATGGRAITFNADGLNSRYRVGTRGAIRAHHVRGEILTVLQRWTPLARQSLTQRLGHMVHCADISCLIFQVEVENHENLLCHLERMLDAGFYE